MYLGEDPKPQYAHIWITSFQNLLPKPELIWLAYCEPQDTNLGVEMCIAIKCFHSFFSKISLRIHDNLKDCINNFIKFYEGFFINQSLYYKVKLSATWPSSVHWQHLDNSTFTWQYLELWRNKADGGNVINALMHVKTLRTNKSKRTKEVNTKYTKQ